MDLDPELKQKVTNKPTWTRGLYILLFIVIYSVAELVVYAVVLLQFLFSLFTGSRNAQLLGLGNSLSTFMYQILKFITYTSDDKPYPFGPWPGAETSSTAPVAVSAPTPAARPDQPKKAKKAAKKKAAKKSDSGPTDDDTGNTNDDNSPADS